MGKNRAWRGGGRGGHGGGGSAKRGRFMRRDFKEGRPNEWKKSEGEQQQDGGWKTFTYENEAFEAYYKTQKIVNEDEWEQFLAILKTPLPTTFRINGSGRFAYEIRDQMQRDFFDFLNEKIEVDGEVLEPPRPLSWYPDNLAWHLNFSRMQLRRLPILAKIFEFMKRENVIGSITRQEAVSMVPPLFLDIEPHHFVLDMCAAPGSKTFQLLEMLHKGGDPAILPSGLVVANDVDVQRCHLLVHQTQRVGSPSILVTNHEAQLFPALRLRADSASEKEEALGGREGIFFDRILCDVPCSGDGTLRKAPDIWRKWNAAIGNGLHPLQVRIAMRGVALLKVGGRLIYSTCSLNPIEDEAVVAQVLRESGGAVELVDASHLLPQLKRRPGLRSWQVKDRKQWYTSYADVDKERSRNILPSMFPSGKGFHTPSESGMSKDTCQQETFTEEARGTAGTADSGTAAEGESAAPISEREAESSELPLDRCMRILPHDQDTGGFFIAVLQKVAPLTAPSQLSSRDRYRIERNLQAHGTPKPSTAEAVPFGATDLDTTAAEIQGGQKVGLDSDAMGEEASKGGANMGAAERSKSANAEMMEIDGVGTLLSEQVKGEGELPDDLPAKEDDENGLGEVLEDDGGQDDEEGERGTLEDVLEDVGHEDGGNDGIGQKGSLEKGPEKRVQQQGRWRGVDPVLFLKDEGILSSIESYYGFAPTVLRGRLITRSADVTKMKRMYYIAEAVANVISLNFRTGEQLKIVSAGLKAFERQAVRDHSGPCAFRISSEGLPILLPHLTRQIVECSREDFCLLLERRSLPFTDFLDPTLVTALQAALLGCLVLVLRSVDQRLGGDGETIDKGPPMAVGVWRGRSSLSLLVTKEESQQMLDRLKPPEEPAPSQPSATAVGEIGDGDEEPLAPSKAEGDVQELPAAPALPVAGGEDDNNKASEVKSNVDEIRRMDESSQKGAGDGDELTGTGAAEAAKGSLET